MLTSSVCKFSDFSEGWYVARERDLRIRQIFAGHSSEGHGFVNRKFWEWCSIAQVLDEHNMLAPNRRGLGFAVGTEPLASYFAAKGCRIVASDLDESMSDPGWINSGQHAASLDALYQPLLVDRDRFLENVSFTPLDMRNIEGLPGGYDFVWSSCALEHLGTLRAGMDFILQSAKLLNPGGAAIHTTEFNVDSDTDTIEAGANVIYRRRDILELQALLGELGFSLSAPNFETGSHQFDLDADRPPYMESERRHIKLMIDGHVSTSMLLVVENTGG